MKTTILAVTLIILSLKVFSQEKYEKENSMEIIRNGIKLHDDAKYDEAIAQFKKVHHNDSNFILASIELINSYSAVDKDSLSIKLCDELLRQKNDYTPNALLLKANALDNLKEYDQSEKIYRQGAKDYPVNSRFYHELGVSKMKQKKFYEAHNFFIQAININPSYAPSHFQMANLARFEGKYVAAMLAYQYYLICDKSSDRAMKVIGTMESISKVELTNDSLITISELAAEDDFSELESIFKSKVALSEKYKSKTDMKYDVTKQMQLIIENIDKYKDVTGFYNTFYGKVFAGINELKYLAPYLYYSFSGIDNESTKKMTAKHQKEIDVFTTWLYNYMCVKQSTYSEHLKDKMVDVPHWFGDDNRIQAAGLRNIQQKNNGYWNFYYPNGILKSEGNFIDGVRDGLWKYYFKAGDLHEEEVYKNGVLVHYKEFYYNNSPKTDYSLTNGLINGKAVVYYSNGKPRSTYEYVSGKINGIEKSFYRNGSERYSITNVDGKYDGAFTEYYDNGKVSEIYTLVNNKREGTGKSFYNNETNTLYSEGIYKNGSYDGNWKFYHKNGKLLSEGNYKEGSKDGLWKSYYKNGTLSDEENYSNNKSDGITKSYNEDGTLWEEYLYKKGKFVDYKVYKNNGELIASNKLNGKNFSFTLYYSNGKKRKEGTITDGDLDGNWKLYNKYNVLEREVNYVKGLMEGKCTDFYINGNVHIQRYYTKGEENGMYREYFLNGKVKTEGWMVNGQNEGYWKTYYIDGVLSEVSYYHNGELEGWTEDRDETGRLAGSDFYQLSCITQVIKFDTLEQVNNNTKLPGGNGILNYKYPDGQTRFYKEFVNDYAEGKSINYYPDGKIQSERTYKGGKIVGPQTIYDAFGKVIALSDYFNGMLNGKSIEYFYNGKKETEFNYVDDEHEGTAYVYHPNGKISKELFYKDGKLQGESKIYDEFGQLCFQRLYDDDLLISYSYNDANGNLLPYKKLEPGEVKITGYFPNGKKSTEVSYFNGELNGKRIIYASNGNITTEDNYSFGVPNGLSKEFYSNGSIKSLQNFNYGYETGLSKEYYKNGKIRVEKSYLNGILHGPTMFYDETGKLVKTINYYYDISVSMK